MRSALALVTRHPIRTAFFVALGLRMAVALVVVLFADGFLFLDDRSYSELAARLAEIGLTQGSDPLIRWAGAFIVPLAALYEVFGEVPLLGQLYAAAAGAGTAAATAYLGKSIGSTDYSALLAGLLVAVFPSQVLWSSLVLKDALIWFSFSMIAAGTLMVQRASRRQQLLTGLCLVVGFVVLLAFLRSYSMILATWGAGIALLFGSRYRRFERIGAATALIVVLPLILGYGPAGGDVLRDVQDVPNYRARGAAFGSMDIAEESAPDDLSTAAEIARLPRAAAIVVLGPAPWQVRGWAEAAILTENVFIWFPTLALATIGLRRRYRDPALIFPVLALGGMIVMYALSEGNFGTAYRHRAEMVWIVALLGATSLRTGNLTAPASDGRYRQGVQPSTQPSYARPDGTSDR